MARNQSRMPAPPNAGVLADNPEAAPQPVHELDGTELDVASEPMPEMAPVAPRAQPKRKLKVTANRQGFIHQERKSAGDKFEVFPHELGSWMDCEDRVEQKKHLDRMAAKKKAVNSKAVAEQEAELADE